MIRWPRYLRFDLVLVLVAVALLAGSAAVTTGRLDVWLTRPCAGIIAVYVVAIAVGERFRVEHYSGRVVAPLATASALAFALTQPGAGVLPGGHHPYDAFAVVVATGLAMALGALPDLVRGRRVDLRGPVGRLICTAVVAFLYRQVPLIGGEPLMLFVRRTSPTQDGPYVALLMLAVSGAALGVLLVLAGLEDAARAHAPLGRVLVDTVSALGGLAAALAATASLIALAYQLIGPLAMPLMLAPLALTQLGVRRYAGIRATQRQTIVALSRLTEISGYTASGHPERVAALSVSLGRYLGMSERAVTDLEYAALLHDIGQVGLVDPIPGGATIMAAPADQHRIAVDGAYIVRETGVLDQVATILEAQATPYRQTRELGQELPLAGRIIKVANAYDDLAEGRNDLAHQETAMERIYLGLGYEYDPLVVQALSYVLERGGA